MGATVERTFKAWLARFDTVLEQLKVKHTLRASISWPQNFLGMFWCYLDLPDDTPWILLVSRRSRIFKQLEILHLNMLCMSRPSPVSIQSQNVKSIGIE